MTKGFWIQSFRYFVAFQAPSKQSTALKMRCVTFWRLPNNVATSAIVFTLYFFHIWTFCIFAKCAPWKQTFVDWICESIFTKITKYFSTKQWLQIFDIIVMIVGKQQIDFRCRFILVMVKYALIRRIENLYRIFRKWKDFTNPIQFIDSNMFSRKNVASFKKLNSIIFYGLTKNFSIAKFFHQFAKLFGICSTLNNSSSSKLKG